MALIGIAVLILNKETLFNLVISIGWVSISSYALSIIISMISASISWGSVSLTEPYMVMSIQVLLASLVVQISYYLIPWLKLKSVMSIIPIIFLIWITNSTNVVLHPVRPIRDSSSGIIKLSFISVFIPCVILTGYIAIHLYRYLNSVNADVSADNNEEV